MNIGTAIKDAGRIPASIWATSVSVCPKLPKTMYMPNPAAAISGIIIGKPSSRRTTITAKIVSAM